MLKAPPGETSSSPTPPSEACLLPPTGVGRRRPRERCPRWARPGEGRPARATPRGGAPHVSVPPGGLGGRPVLAQNFPLLKNASFFPKQNVSGGRR